MKKIKSEKGQALILIALAVVALVAFSALTIDGGRVLSDRRHAQNAADTSVLAAALAKVRNQDYTVAAQNRASSNGYVTDADSTVEVVLCSQTTVGDECQGLPNGATASEYIRVRITSIVPTTFARVIGRQQVTNIVEAIARAQGSVFVGSFFGGAGMAATKDAPEDQCFLLNGNADVYLHDTGIFVNCTGDEALFINGGLDLHMDDDAMIAGCARNQGGTVTGDGEIVCDAPQQTVNEATFANVPTALATPTCNTNGTVTGPGVTASGSPPNVNVNNGVTGVVFGPGNFGSINLGETATFSPGVYCISNMNVNGSANINGPSGTVKFVLASSLNLSGNANNFNDLEVYVTNGTLRITGSLNASRLRFFAKGTGDFIQQNGFLTSDNAYIYSYRGAITINSQAEVDLHAPPQGDTFGGLLMHLPWGNTNAFILNGGTEDLLTGTIMVPTSDVTFNGGSGFELHGQIIGYTFKINGDGDLDIFYDASENYNPPNDPTIELTK